METNSVVVRFSRKSLIDIMRDAAEAEAFWAHVEQREPREPSLARWLAAKLRAIGLYGVASDGEVVIDVYDHEDEEEEEEEEEEIE